MADNKQMINIYGAGMAGLLAGVILSKNNNVEIYEKKTELITDHHALLRFKDNTIEEYTGIKCKKVSIQKAIYYKNTLFSQSNILLDNLYSQKVIGCISTRSIGNLSIGTRYIPPTDFYEQLIALNKDRIHLGSPMKTFDPGKITVSTIPLPIIYTQVMTENIEFKNEEIVVATKKIKNCDVYQTIYFPEDSAEFPCYRISINGNHIICEMHRKYYSGPFTVGNWEEAQFLIALNNQIAESFGISRHILINYDFDFKFQKYGKIINIDEHKRQSILYNLTQQHNVYSLGRFACWRNHTMLADVVQDILQIQKWIHQRNYLSPYEQQKKM